MTEDKEEWGPWIDHDGKGCPCVGVLTEVMYNDQAVEVGIAEDHVYWRYVSRYRLPLADLPAHGSKDVPVLVPDGVA